MDGYTPHTCVTLAGRLPTPALPPEERSQIGRFPPYGVREVSRTPERIV